MKRVGRCEERKRLLKVRQDWSLRRLKKRGKDSHCFKWNIKLIKFYRELDNFLQDNISNLES